MIVRSRGADREYRAAEWGTSHHIPSPWQSSLAFSGEPVSHETAAGLPALGHAIRLVSGVIAQLYLGVWEGRKGDKKPRDDAWQAEVLGNPWDMGSDFDWRWDIAASLESCENALLFKARNTRGRVEALLPVDVDYARIYQDDRTGEKLFDIGTRDGFKTFTARDILHIRGQTLKGGIVGVSRIHQHRDPIGSMLAKHRFEGRHFLNNAAPGVILEAPMNVTREQASEWKALYDAEHAGADNAGKTTVIGGGWKAHQFPISLSDAQFVEAKQLSLIEVGQIMDIHPVFLGASFSVQQLTKELVSYVLQVQFGPRLRRIERALKADPDLFGAKVPVYPKFEVDDLMFADALTRAQVQHLQIQNGSLLPDEARADNGRMPLPPIPDDWMERPGQVPQITPVGGAPNPNPSDPAPSVPKPSPEE